MTQQYQNLLHDILAHGVQKSDRTGTGTISTFGCRMSFNLAEGFPLVTTKKVHFKSVVAELLWFLSGSTFVQDLQAMGCTIWDEWAREDGSLGPVYGFQWRSWEAADGEHIDQISNVIEGIKRDPDGRRHIVSAWNVGALRNMALPPCHVLFQFYVANGRLSCQLYQRSADAFLGVPFNIASYALLTHMVAAQCNLQVGDLIWVGGDCHIYLNHMEQVNTLLSRAPRQMPFILLDPTVNSVFDYRPDHIQLMGYDPHPAISAPVAV